METAGRILSKGCYCEVIYIFALNGAPFSSFNHQSLPKPLNQVEAIRVKLNLLLTIGETGEDGEVLLVEVLELWARELRNRVRENVGDWLEGGTESSLETGELVDATGLSSLESEASKVVALEKVGTVEDTTSNVTKVDTSEGVGSSGVTTDLNGVWVGGSAGEEINEHIGEVVCIGSVAAVPVQRNACFMLVTALMRVIRM